MSALTISPVAPRPGEAITAAPEALLEVARERDGYVVKLNETLRALDELVKLQAHYARLLNQYDGGKRRAFVDAKAWLARLSEIDAETEAKQERES